ncbi:TM2 domain-containing protein [bacterium]|nr:TM2 domain-containing protein [bacterium]
MGVEKKENILVRGINFLFALKERREPVKIKRKTYLLTALFLGWCGGHRFLAKQYVLGCLYAALFWTGLPIAMTIIDLMIALPLPQDEDGYIEV